METWSVRLEDEIVRLQFGAEAVECVRSVRRGEAARRENEEEEAPVVSRLLRHGVLVRDAAGVLGVSAGGVYQRLLYTEYLARVAAAHGRAAEVLAETLFRVGRVSTVRAVAAAATQLAPEVAAERGGSSSAGSAAEAEAEARVRTAAAALVAAGVAARTALSAAEGAAEPASVVYFDGVGARADATALALCLDRLADRDALDFETRLVADTLGPSAAALYSRLAGGSGRDGDSDGGDDSSGAAEGALETLCACGFCSQSDGTAKAERREVQRVVARGMVRDVVRRKLGGAAALLFALVAADPVHCCGTAALAQRAVVSGATATALLRRLRECGYVRGCSSSDGNRGDKEGEEGEEEEECWWWCDAASARAVCVEELCRALVMLLARGLAEENAPAPSAAGDRATATILQLARTLVFLAAAPPFC